MNRQASIQADLTANDHTLTEAIDAAILFRDQAALRVAYRSGDLCELGRVLHAMVEAELADNAQDAVLFAAMPVVAPPSNPINQTNEE